MSMSKCSFFLTWQTFFNMRPLFLHIHLSFALVKFVEISQHLHGLRTHCCCQNTSFFCISFWSIAMSMSTKFRRVYRTRVTHWNSFLTLLIRHHQLALRRHWGARSRRLVRVTRWVTHIFEFFRGYVQSASRWFP